MVQIYLLPPDGVFPQSHSRELILSEESRELGVLHSSGNAPDERSSDVPPDLESSLEGLLESLVESAVASLRPDIGFLAVVPEFLEDVIALDGSTSGLVRSNVVEVLVLEGVLNIVKSRAVSWENSSCKDNCKLSNSYLVIANFQANILVSVMFNLNQQLIY